MDPPVPRPGRLEVRAGVRPGTAFGVDDSRAPVSAHTYRSADGHTWDAVLARPWGHRGRERGDVVVVVVHGSMGNYITGVPRRAAIELARAGYAALSVNTRMANYGVVYGGGLFDRTPADLDGALGLAAELGYRRVVLMGYGLGATMVTHYQALRRPEAVEALCTLAHPASLPDAMRERWARNASRPSYEEMTEAAAAHAEGPDDIVVIARGSGPTSAPSDSEVWTYHAWWACRAPRARHAVSLERIREVTVPVALIQPGTDTALGYGIALAAAAAEAGVDAHLERIPSCDHTFWGVMPVVARAAAAWLDDTLGKGGAGRAPGPAPSHAPVRHRLVTVAAADGARHDAMLHVDRAAADRRAARRGRRTAVLHVHGNQGNFTVGALRFLGDPLALDGVPLLSLETRLSNVSQLFGAAVFEDALDDLDAGVAWLEREGYDGVVVSGYSLGANLAVRFAAELDPPFLRGLVTFGCAWSLPASSERRMDALGARPTYAALAAECAETLARGEDRIVVARRAYLPDDAPRAAGVYTTGTWWHSRGPEAVDAMAHRHVGRVRAPILLVQGDADQIVEPGEAGALAEIARAAGNPDVEVASIPGASHSFAGHEDQVTGAVIGFLERVG